MASRELLQYELEEVLGSDNVYFQPPENVKIQYPCIVYEYETPDVMYANNNAYFFIQNYKVTYITREPDNDMTERLLRSFKRIRPENSYVADTLYHYPFNLYY